MKTKDRERLSGAARPRQKKSAGGDRQRSADREVVYTQPAPFKRNHFLLRLATVVAVVLALTFGMAIFFKVSAVTVAGTDKYEPWEIEQASGIQSGESLLTLNRTRIAGRIKTALPYVKTVRVGIKLPDTVNIEITELDVVYSAEAEDGSWWLMSAAGKIVDKVNAVDAKAYTRIQGIVLTSPVVGQQAQAVENVPTETMEEGQTVPKIISAAEQLDTAIAVLQQLENSGIMEQITTVDVSDLENLEIWYGQRYQVLLGNKSRLEYKIDTMKAAVAQMGDYQSGILDISFTNWPNEVSYTPFESNR